MSAPGFSKIETKDPENEFYQFYCPGCREPHIYYAKWGKDALESRVKAGFSGNPPTWTFNGNMESPSFEPSLLNTWHPPSEEHKKKVCHLYLRNGVIEFLGDCTHDHAGRRVPLQEWPQD